MKDEPKPIWLLWILMSPIAGFVYCSGIAIGLVYKYCRWMDSVVDTSPQRFYGE